MNSVAKVIKSFKNDLELIYPKEEIKSIIELVFEHYLDFSKTDFITKSDKTLSISETDLLVAVLERLKKHEPVQYILGETVFYDLKFLTEPGVLIPRPETEELVDWIIMDNAHLGDLKVLDIGTGSGCIAISLAAHLNNSNVFAYDISDKAIELTQKNANLNKQQVTTIKKDIISTTNITEIQQFDIIVSNPPYVLEKEKELMAKNVLEYEPEMALFVENDDALLFYNAIISYSKLNLKTGGKLYFEINESKGKAIENALQKAGFENIIIKKDINGKDRMVYGEK